MSHTEMARARGRVYDISRHASGWAIVFVMWDDRDHRLLLPNKINEQNLAFVGPNPRFSKM